MKQTSLDPSTQHALVILDEIGLILATQIIRQRVARPMSVSKVFLPVLLIQSALVVERLVWIGLHSLFLSSEKLELLISHTKELAVAMFLNLSFPYFFFHEYGHVFLAKLFFKNSTPKVIIQPFQSGKTVFSISYGTRGLKKKWALPATFLGGMAGSFFIGVGSTGVARLIEKNSPRVAQIAQQMKIFALSQIAQETFYAISFYWTSPRDQTHDLVRFCQLAAFPAYVPTTILITATVLVALNLCSTPSASHQLQ